MNVAFDLKNLWLYGKGIGAFSLNLLYDLSGKVMPDGLQIQLYAPSFNIAELDSIAANRSFQRIATDVFDKKSKWDKLKYDQHIFYKSLRRNKADLLFSPYFDIPLRWQKPLIATIHDLSIYDKKGGYGKAFYMYYNRLLRKAVHASSYIVTVSDFSRQLLIEKLHLPPERVKVMYNKVLPAFLQSAQASLDTGIWTKLKTEYRLPDSFILYTGGLEARKNISLLVGGLAGARSNAPDVPPVVITGLKGRVAPAAYSAILSGNHIILADFLSVEELACLYKKASLVVNTSAYEGFGIPVLEALTMGSPMLCSDIPVYKEVGKDHVHYFAEGNQSSFEEAVIAFFRNQLPRLNTTESILWTDHFNKRNYAELFVDLVTASV